MAQGSDLCRVTDRGLRRSHRVGMISAKAPLSCGSAVRRDGAGVGPLPRYRSRLTPLPQDGNDLREGPLILWERREARWRRGRAFTALPIAAYAAPTGWE